MSRSMNTNNRKKKTEADEVEELLRAAEDDVFLKLSLNSHMARGSSTQFIDPDLDQRFQSLKSKKTPKNKNPITSQQKPSSASISPATLTTTTEDSGDDLFARFAALKSSLPSAASTSVNKHQAPVVENINEDDDEDEVEKVIKWAIDAARLDPSPPSDSDDEKNHSSCDDAEEEDEDSEDDYKVKRGKSKAKRK